MGPIKSIKVWDLPTRVFHWALAAAVLGAFFTSAGRPHGFTFLLHVTCGYTVVLLLVYRFAWGFVGNETARFAAFVRGWQEVKAHARNLVRLTPFRTVGHNPIGGWMILLMLATLVSLVLTGLLTQGVTGGAGPLVGVLPTALVKPVGTMHRWLGNTILILAGVHLAGVVVESLLLKENLTRAMLTGRKPAEGAEVPDVRAAPAWRAVALVAALALLGGAMAAVTKIPAEAPPREGKVMSG